MNAQAANVFGNDNIVVQASGSGVNVIVAHGRPYLRLTRYAVVTAREAKGGAEKALLSPFRRDVVPLIGRDAEKASLRAWLESDADLSMRVLIGGGGRGKTRLAAEFADEVGGEWLAGFIGASEFDRFRRDGHTEDWRWDKPVLVIVDYPASRVAALKDWLRELVNVPLDGRPKLRLLLLERQAQREFGWLAELVGQGQDGVSAAKIGLLDPPEPVELAPLEGLAFRREVFAALLARAAPQLSAPRIGADGEFDRQLAEHKWGGDPLFLMMAALVAAKAGIPAALSLSRTELAEKLAEQELDRIGRIGAARGIDAPNGRFLRRMAALATLVQGASAEAARALAQAEREALGSSVDLDAVVEALKEALPSLEAGKAVGAILPDIVGEAALLRVFGEGSAAGVRSAPRIAAAARTALQPASATLIRTAQDFAAAGYLEPVHWLEALAEAPETDLGALMQIADALPHQTLALRETAVRLFQKILAELADVQKISAADGGLESTVAVTLNNLGGCFSNLGRREEALNATQEAVEIRRRLAAARPDAFLPNLAMSLNNLGNCFSDLRRREDALNATQQAVDALRRLAAARPDAFLPDLAMALNNLGSCFSDLGRREDALNATQEAVEIRRRLAAARPDAFLPDLASALNNLGVLLSALGRGEDALNATREAIEIRRRLAAARPDAFLPNLALALNNLGDRLHEQDRHEEAHGAAKEAVVVLAPFFLRLPRAHSGRMAMMLRNYLERAKDASAEPDNELLAPIAAALEALQSQDKPSP